MNLHSTLSRCLCVLLLSLWTVPTAAPAEESHVTRQKTLRSRKIGPGPFGSCYAMAFHPTNPDIFIFGVDMGEAFMTTDGGKTWASIGSVSDTPCGQPAYRGAWCVKFDPVKPEIIWFASTHGIFKSEDLGKHWKMKLGGKPDGFGQVEIDPSNDKVIYAATGVVNQNSPWSSGKIYKSANGGETWDEINVVKNPKGYNWGKIVIDTTSKSDPAEGCQKVYLVGNRGLFVSTDAGKSWNPLNDRLPGGGELLEPQNPKNEDGRMSSICDLILIPKDKATTKLFAFFRPFHPKGKAEQLIGGIYRSDDGGQSWVENNEGLQSKLLEMLKMSAKLQTSYLCYSPKNPEVLYWAAPYAVYKSVDQAAHWTRVTDEAYEWTPITDFDGKEKHAQLSRPNTNYQKAFYGSITASMNNLVVAPSNPDFVAYSENSGIGWSKDGGKTWDEPTFEYGEAIHPNAFGDRPPMRLTHLVRSKGIQIIVPHDIAVDPFNPKNLAVAYDDLGMMISRDDANWWEWEWDGMLVGDRFEARSVCYDPRNKDKIYLVTQGDKEPGKVYESSNGGKTFHVIGEAPFNSGSHDEASTGKAKLYVVILDPSAPKDQTTLYVSSDRGVFKTSDNGKTWESCFAGFDSRNVKHLLINPKDSKILYAANPIGVGFKDKPGLYRTIDGGKTWQRLAGEQIGGVRSLSICASNPKVLVAVTNAPMDPNNYWNSSQLWKTTDGGDTWEKLVDSRVICAAVNPTNPDDIVWATNAQDLKTEPVGLWRSDDGGKTNTRIDQGLSFSLGVLSSKIVFDPTNPKRFFFLTNSSVIEMNE